MNNTKWFRRGDGVLFCSNEGSATHEAMQRNGEFSECDADGNELDINEGNSEIEQSAVEPGGPQGDPGQSGAGERDGAGDGDQAKDPEQPAGGQDVQAIGDNQGGDETAAGSRPNAKKRKS